MIKRILLATMAVLLLASAAGCGGDDDDTAAPSTESTDGSATGSTEGTDASDTPASPSAAPSSPAPPVPTPDLSDAPAFRGDAASGSGCTPGAGSLPDGWWYGVAATRAADDSSFTLDLACYYTGAVAETIAAGRGDEVNNDVYIVNDNATLRTMPIASGITARCVDLVGGAGGDLTVSCPFTDIPEPGPFSWGVWFRVVGGEVDRAVEQYHP